MTFNKHLSRTADNVLITKGLAVWTNDFTAGVIIADRDAEKCCGQHPAAQVAMPGGGIYTHHDAGNAAKADGCLCGHDHWYDVKTEREVRQYNGERMATRTPGKPPASEAIPESIREVIPVGVDSPSINPRTLDYTSDADGMLVAAAREHDPIMTHSTDEYGARLYPVPGGGWLVWWTDFVANEWAEYLPTLAVALARMGMLVDAGQREAFYDTTLVEFHDDVTELFGRHAS